MWSQGHRVVVAVLEGNVHIIQVGKIKVILYLAHT